MSEPKILCMRMAKASQEDLDGMFKFSRILSCFFEGYFPEDEDGLSIPEEFEGQRFDEDNSSHLDFFYQTIKKFEPSGFFRVTAGYQTILDNDILDPNDTCLATNDAKFVPIQIHEKLLENMIPREKVQKILDEISDWSYCPENYGRVANLSDVQDAFKSIAGIEPKEQERK